MRRLLSGMAWLLLVPLALLLSVCAHLRSDFAREVIRDEALTLVSAQLRGRLEAESMPTLTTQRIELRNVRVFDPQGDEVAHVKRLRAHFDLGSLLAGTVLLPQVGAEGGFVSLDGVESEKQGLAAAFRPTGPPEPEPETQEAAPVDVRISDIHIDELDVRRSVEGMAQTALTDIRLRGSMQFEEHLTLNVSRLTAGVWRAGGAVGRLTNGELAFHMEPEKASRIDLGLRVRQTEAHASGTWTMLPEDAPSPVRFDAALDVDGLSSEALRALGLQAAASQLRASVDAHVEAEGTLDDLQGHARLEAAGGTLKLQAQYSDRRRIEATLTAENVSPHRIVAAAPEVAVGGRVQASYELTEGGDPFQVSLHEVHAGEVRIPSLEIRGAVLDDAVRIDAVEAPYLKGRLDVQARVGFDGAVRASIDARLPALQHETNLRRMAPTLRGAVLADIEMRRSSTGRIRFGGTLQLRDLDVGALRVGHARIQGRAFGRPEELELDARVRVRDAVFQDRRVQRLRLHVTGGPREYQAQGRLDAEDVEARLDGRLVRLAEQTLRVDLRARAKGLAGREWHATVQNLRVHPSQGLKAGLVRVRTGKQSVRVSGRYAFDGPSDLQVVVEALSLETIAALAPDASLPQGRIDMRAGLRGSPSAPRIELDARYYGGIAVDSQMLTASIDGRLDAPAGAARIDAQANVGPAGHLSSGQASLVVQSDFRAGRGDWLQRLKTGQHDVVLDLQGVRWELLHMLAPDALPRGAGQARARAELHGTLQRAKATVEVNSQVHLEGDPSRIEVDFDADYDAKDLRVDLRIDDTQGKLLEAHGDVALETRLLAGGPAAIPRVLSETSWNVFTKLHSRRFDEFPMLPDDVRDALPLRVGLELRLEHQPRREPVGDLELNATWELPDLEAEGNISPRPRKGRSRRCPEGPTPELSLHAHLEGGMLRVNARGTAKGEQVLQLEASTPAPVHSWAGGARIRLGPANLHAELDEVNLAHVPYICSYSEGTVSADVDLEQIFTAQPSASVRVEGDSLRVGDTEALALSLKASTAPDWLEISGRVSQRDHERATIDARVPIEWGHRAPAPALRTDGDLDARVQLDEIPLKPVLRWVPAVTYVSGHASGEVQAHGPVLEPNVSGRLQFSKVDLTLIDIGQPLENASGLVRFDGKRIVLERFEVHDRDGSLNAHGALQFLDEKWLAELTIETDGFPVRKQGVIMAELDTKTKVQAEIADEAVDVRIKIRDARVWLTGDGLGDLQSLEPHSDIVFASELDDTGAETGEEQPGAAEPMAVNVHIDATEPFWVRRADFSVQLSAKIDVHVENGTTRLTGQVKPTRGFIELLGKSFDIEQGTIRFTGAQPPNPALDITATQGALGGSDPITVRITGRMSDPVLKFIDEQGSDITAGQAFGPSSGGGAGLAAEDQAMSAISGMTTGLLTLGARRGLGGLVPVIRLETAGARAARLRAGLQADRIIPEFLKGIVQGAYVEGIIGTGGTTASGEQGARGSGRVSGGVLIELRFPYDLVSTARFWPGQTWSVDMTWEP